ncbi:MAG: L,D-transpeptidase [Chlorobiales bacterium]|nr:L,D-transpeptidase [Chlorobiales bacterium]
MAKAPKHMKNGSKRLVFFSVFVSLMILNTADTSAKDHKDLDFASEEVQKTVSWVKKNKDNHNFPYAIIDKKNAHIFVFDAKSKLVDHGPVLLGIAKSDKIDPKTLNARLSSIGKKDRVTPSGRYVSVFGPDHRGKDVLWVDTKYAVGLHPVANVPGQKRITRLQSSTPADNRITWGCINVSKPLFKNVLTPLFKPKAGIVYILPESAPVEQLLASKDKD